MEPVSNPSARPVSPAAGRRDFLGQLATAAVAIAGTAACAPAATQSAAPAPTPAPPSGATSGTTIAAAPARSPARKWDDSWVSRITGKHKAVFDAPSVADGTIVSNTWVWMRGYSDVYQTTDSDLSAVMVIRHAGISMAFDDELWAKYELGKHAKVKDEKTKQWATRNPFWKPAPDEKSNDFTFDALVKRGAIVMVCNYATGGLAAQIAERTKQKTSDVRKEVDAHLIPGATLAPSGVFVTMRAQEAGCVFLRST